MGRERLVAQGLRPTALVADPMRTSDSKLFSLGSPKTVAWIDFSDHWRPAAAKDLDGEVAAFVLHLRSGHDLEPAFR